MRGARAGPVSIRFRTPDEGRSTFDDVDPRRGRRSSWSTIPDFVIVRSNGTPVFFLANAVDDLDMGITHVLRGEDLIDSTHRVLALRRALGHDDQPVYAHLPLILGPGGGKLSKRHGAVSVEEYRDAGYLPGCARSTTSRCSAGDRRTAARCSTLDELVAEFDLDRVNTSAATFDPKKLEWMNGEHIRALPLRRAGGGGAAVRPRRATATGSTSARSRQAVALAQERATTLVQIADQMAFLFTPDDELEIDAASWEKLAKVERAAEILDAVIAHVETCEWTSTASTSRHAIEALGLKPGKAMHVALHGDRGPQPGSAALRLDRPARARVGAAPSAGRARRAAVSGRARVQDRAARVALAIFARRASSYLSVVFVQVWLAARRDDARPVGRDRRARRRAVRRPSVAGPRGAARPRDRPLPAWHRARRRRHRRQAAGRPLHRGDAPSATYLHDHGVPETRDPAGDDRAHRRGSRSPRPRAS